MVGKFHPISYFSKRISQAESRHHSFELIALAIVHPPGRFRTCLQGIKFKNLPFDCIHLDHYDPLERTGHRLKYIFEIIDAFTKFIKLYPVMSTSADEGVCAAENMKRWIHEECN